ncbi:MAG: RecB family exonuclease [Acidimicrobiales bacterium]
MALTPPATLSPSKISSFSDCALAFRLSSIDGLPEPPSAPATKGTMVHLALQHLFDRAPAERTLAAAEADLDRAFAEMATDPDYTGLDLAPDEESTFLADAQALVHRYFEMEDPTAITPIGLELKLEARVGDIRVRGIIDRLELDAQGGLVVTDYKTGRAPGTTHQQGRLGGVTFYALLCEEVFGVRPARVQLLYLGDGITITTEASGQSTRGLRTKISALWSAVERACEREDFRPRPGPPCAWCGFHAYCPAQGGDLALIPAAEVRAPVLVPVPEPTAVP